MEYEGQQIAMPWRRVHALYGTWHWLKKKSELLSLRSHEGVCLSSGAPRKGVNMLYPAQTSGSWFWDPEFLPVKKWAASSLLR